MKLSTTLDGVTYRFTGIPDVLAKANEPKAADRLQGIAAQSASERVAAKIVLSYSSPTDNQAGSTHPS